VEADRSQGLVGEASVDRMFPFGRIGFAQDIPSGAPAPSGAFTRRYRCYPVSFVDKSMLENGDKVILPHSALNALTQLNILFPMLFQVEGPQGLQAHCGVMEFTAEEGHCYIPYWLMQQIGAEEGGIITIRNVNLLKGTYVKFQPQTLDFLDISNPKAVLEATLRNFTCLTKGGSFPINYNEKTYWISVPELRPGNAVSIIETDIDTEFAPPPGYKEPDAPPKETAAPSAASVRRLGDGSNGQSSSRLQSRLEALRRLGAEDSSDSSDSESEDKTSKTLFPGQGQTLVSRPGGAGSLITSTLNDAEMDQPLQEAKPFTPFTGAGHRLR